MILNTLDKKAIRRINHHCADCNYCKNPPDGIIFHTKLGLHEN